MRYFQYFLLFLGATAPSALASAGDRSNEFQHCVQRCNTAECEGPQTPILPLELHLTRWTCTDNCIYICTHEITTRNIAYGFPVLQYYGKWPFWRFSGMQEPASVAFSLLNLWAHGRGMCKILREISNSHPMKPYYLLWSIVSMNTWVWSSIFHTRDTPFTERLDYFSAALTIMTAFYFTVIRLFHLYSSPGARSKLTLSGETCSPENNVPLRLWSAACFLTYFGHIFYLTSQPRFDYSYNIIFNLVIGLAHNLLWILYSLPAPISVLRRFSNRSKRYRPSFTYKAALLVVLMSAAMSLELLDFPPVGRVIDAHSLWHLSTVPIAILWYRFLIQDANDESWKEHRT